MIASAEIASIVATRRGPTRRLLHATAAERIENQTKDPTQTPARRTRADAVDDPTAFPVDAAEKIAAHDTTVIGLEAVAPSEVTKARRGESTSSGASPPSRMRNALQSVRSPRKARTAAPARPRTIRSAPTS